MFDVILNKIKECASTAVLSRAKDANEESVIVKLEPISFDAGVCNAHLEILCVAKSYERALLSFDRILEGLDALPEESGEVLDIELKSTVIKYDTVTGMTRLLGVFDAFTEVGSDDIDE